VLVHNVKDLEMLMMHNRVFCAEVGLVEAGVQEAGRGVGLLIPLRGNCYSCSCVLSQARLLNGWLSVHLHHHHHVPAGLCY
jgi:hypothetical protein